MNPGPDTAGPSGLALPLALAAELAGRASIPAAPRPPEVRTTTTAGRKRRAARRRAAAVRG